MPQYIRELKELMDRHALDADLLPPAKDLLDEAAKLVSGGQYLTLTQDKLNQGEICRALGLALTLLPRIIDPRSGPPVDCLEIVLLPLASPERWPLRDQALWADVDFSLWEMLRRKHGRTLWEGFSRTKFPYPPDKTVGNKLFDCMEKGVGQAMAPLIEKRLPATLDRLCRRAAAQNWWKTMFYYIGSCMNGDQLRAMRFEPLARQLLTILPLGNRGGNGTWYVFCG